MNDEANKNQDTGVSYPYCPLSLCLPIAEAVKKLGGGNTTVSKSLLAQTLKEDERSQTLLFKIGAAKVFGIIEGRSKLKLTESGKEYFSPTTADGSRKALLDFLERPKAFKLIIQRFDGSKLPDAEILGNILHREAGVPDSWKGRVATSFIKSAQAASAIDSENHLRVKASRESQIAKTGLLDESVGVENNEKEISSPAFNLELGGGPSPADKYKRLAGKLNATSESFMVTRSDDQTGQPKTIYAEVPKELSLPLWNLLNSWVQSLKPASNKK